jgi:hypothetical protein
LTIRATALFAAGTTALAVATACRTAAAAEEAKAEHGGKPAARTADAPVRTDLLDLDHFRVRGCRASDNEIFEIQFGVCLVLSSKMTKADFQELEAWKHRLRDQVIIAVRGANFADFADPELRRLQRVMKFRIKRLPIAENILGIYLTDFSLDEGELPADRHAPPILPSAAPAKKPAAGGGH